MANNFTTSVNIIRDTDRDVNYIPTPNAKQVVSQIVNDFKKGIRSFNIVGTYGTGKSSFLLAFEQSIKGTKRYFEPNFLVKPKYDFVKIVGSYASIVEQFAEEFEVKLNKNQQENILSEIFNRYHSIGKENKVLFILIDEFARDFDAFSIGSNDLTQLTLGVDRDSALVAFDFDERDPGVLQMLRMAIEGAHRNNRPIGICGQGPSDYPDLAAYLIELGIDSISLTPDSLLSTLVAVQALEQSHKD